MKNVWKAGLGLAILAGFAMPLVHADDAADLPTDIDFNLGLTPDPEKGYELIRTEPMSAPLMKVADIPRMWNAWEPEERAKAEAATPEERQRMTFERYGWAERPEGNNGLPLGYTEDGKGGLVTNCFTCHGGKVAGKTMLGVGNTHIDLTTLATDVRRLQTFDRGGDPMKVAEQTGPFHTPLSVNTGFTNAVIFAPMVAAFKDPELFKELTKHPETLLHHNMNPPAWWLYSRKSRIYSDGFAPQTPRQLMPFAMSPTFTYEKFMSFEPNFVHISAYIKSLEAPKYPYAIDKELAAEGEELFVQTCSGCHGTYGADGEWPEKLIPIAKIGTDARRLNSISVERRKEANSGWLQYNGATPLVLEAEGYIAQPLDGIWASAPYLHNGSIPTLYHLMNVEERPAIWKRTENGYDTDKVGLEVETFDEVPEGLSSRIQRRYYNTATPGNGSQGHTFPEELTADEKVAVLEYLKTL